MSPKQAGIVADAARKTVRPQRPGPAVFKAILPEEIDWKPFPSFPPSGRFAVVVGQPLQDGPCTIRVDVRHGVKLMPHKHPGDPIYTVISGVFYIGLGDQFDPEELVAYPPGAVIILPGQHAPRSLGEVRRLHHIGFGIGPLGMEYVNSKDDPRNQTSNI